jgi:diguanylate cyclase (GGDEF)-like protein
VATLAAGGLVYALGWLDARQALQLCGLMLAAIAASQPLLQPHASADWRVLRPSFVIEFTAVLLFALPMLLVAAAGAVTRILGDRENRQPLWRTTLRAMMAIVSLQAAAFVYHLLGGTVGTFVWPWHAVAVAGGVTAYCVATCASEEMLAPLVSGQPIDRSWPTRLQQAGSMYVIGASLAVALAELMARGAWELLPVVAIPVAIAFRGYSRYLNGLERENHQQDLIEGLHQGLCVVDRRGNITLWNQAIEEMMSCPADRALGHQIDSVPALRGTELPRALSEVLNTGAPRTLPHLGIPSAEGARILQVRIVPMTGGSATLLCQDDTEHTRALQDLKRHGERLGLAAESAYDGLWEWELRTEQFYVTGRWKAMMGLPAVAGIVTPSQWLERVHPDDMSSLNQALEAYLSGSTSAFEHEHRIRHEDGTYRSFRCRGVAAGRAGRRPDRIAGSLTDTTDLAMTQERLRNAVFRDPLTGLCNRAVFVEGLGRRLQEFRRRPSGDRFALLYLDLDRFKVVNDSLGHLVGDDLLIAVSRRLESCLRPGDVLARLGGDEFAILLNGLNTEQQANVIALRVQEALNKPFSIAGREVFTSASIGIAFGLPQYTGPDEIMHDADTAMYQAKARGKARHEVFDADMDARARDRLGLENDLRHAVDNNDFELAYQPIVSLASGMCIGFETLVRWTRNGKPVSPAMFIPIAEELGLIEPLGTTVLQQACRTFAGWQRRFPDAGLDCITVNVSSRQLMQQNFLSIVEHAVHEAGLRPRDLRIEITETALMTSPNVAAEVLRHLRDFGARIYLDDFGTGYSSLSHLHKLPVDALKIDRSFVRSLLLPDRPAIVESILALARTLNTSVVAEGIETDVQARELERLGCTHAQGFLFSRPLSTDAAEQIVKAKQPLGPKNLTRVPTAVSA